MNLKEGIVSGSAVKGPFSGTYGDYFSQQLEIEGEKFTKTSKTNTPLASEGDLVKILFNTKTTDKGTFHNIEKLEVLSSANTVGSVTGVLADKGLIGVGSAGTGVAPAGTVKFVPNASKSTFDSNGKMTDLERSEGARNGMIVGKAIELAIARGVLTSEGLELAATDVIELTDFVEKGSSSKKASK